MWPFEDEDGNLFGKEAYRKCCWDGGEEKGDQGEEGLLSGTRPRSPLFELMSHK